VRRFTPVAIVVFGEGLSTLIIWGIHVVPND